jgi:hypothetical protein
MIVVFALQKWNFLTAFFQLLLGGQIASTPVEVIEKRKREKSRSVFRQWAVAIIVGISLLILREIILGKN